MSGGPKKTIKLGNVTWTIYTNFSSPVPPPTEAADESWLPLAKQF